MVVATWQVCVEVGLLAAHSGLLGCYSTSFAKLPTPWRMVFYPISLSSQHYQASFFEYTITRRVCRITLPL